MSKYGSKPNWDCTEFCKSLKHSQSLIASITKRSVTDKEIASYLYEKCCNFAKIQDDFGRTALHIASSCGRLDLCVWLAVVAGADVNVKDWESGYTALQRSLFYGNIDIAVRLIEIGADVSLFDKEDISPLELVTLEKLPEVQIPRDIPSQVYVWGSNLNFTLGIGTDDPRKYPELLDYFKRNGTSVKQVCTDEYHSVFVGTSGQVWVCGHGQGGRLGILKEKPLLIPTLLAEPNEYCTLAATSLNHTLLLLENGSVLAFGSNSHHQLGITSGVQVSLSPRHVQLNNFKTTGICAAKYHSVFYNDNNILVCGLNAGQLGYKPESPYISPPQQISLKEKFSGKIKTVATSCGSVVFATTIGDVYVVNRFQCKKIASRLLGVEKLTAYGGHLNSNIVTESGEDLRLFILTTDGTMLLWEENTTYPMKCSFGLKRTLVISDVHLNEIGVLFSCVDGEVFHGLVKDREPFKLQEDSRKRHSYEKLSKNQNKLGKCIISARRIPHIHRALAVTSDPKGKNFAVLQALPNNSPELYNERSTSEIIEDLKSLLLNVSEDDALHDIVFNVMGTRIPAHRYILAVNGFPIRSLHNNNSRSNKIMELYVNDSHPIIFQDFLMFLYSGDCSLLKIGPCSARFLDIVDNPLKFLLVLAERYKILSLIDRIKDLSFEDGHITSAVNPPRIEVCKMQRSQFPEFFDVELQADNGKIFMAHKCVLAARLPYFNSMFLRGWSETKKAQTIHLQTSTLIAEAFIDFLYTDNIPDYTGCDDLDYIIRLLILSDQLLVNRLKEACEILLEKSLNLKNCVNILQVCNVYNTLKLKGPVMKFIILNLNALLESRLLEALDDKTLFELSEHYKSYNRYCNSRILTPFLSAPSDKELLEAAKSVSSISDNFFTIPDDIKDAGLHKCNKTFNAVPRKKISNKRLSSTQSVELIEENLTQVVPNINKAFNKTEELYENEPFFDKNEFPSLSEKQVYTHHSKPIPIRNRINNDFRKPWSILTQKKKKSLENEVVVPVPSPPKTTFKGWAVIPPIEELSITLSSENKKKEPNLFEIITNEQKKKENWKKMKSKSFHLTQLEDAAIDELVAFYNADVIFDERITVERVLPLNIAQPVWIPGQKKKASNEF